MEGNVMLYEHPAAAGDIITATAQILPPDLQIYVLGNSPDHPSRLANKFEVACLHDMSALQEQAVKFANAVQPSLRKRSRPDDDESPTQLTQQVPEDEAMTLEDCEERLQILTSYKKKKKAELKKAKPKPKAPPKKAAKTAGQTLVPLPSSPSSMSSKMAPSDPATPTSKAVKALTKLADDVEDSDATVPSDEDQD
jgi:hypothetical protein